MMSFLKKDKLFSFSWFKNYLQILVGSIIMASGYVFFIVPHKIIPGGVFGIAIIGHHLWGLPVGTTALVINIPLLVWGVRELGPRFGAKTIIGLLLTSTMIDLITYSWGAAPLSPDPLLSCVFGGVFIGTGLGLIFRSKATSGGSDIVAQIVNKRSRIPIGQALMIVDSLVVTLGVLAFRDFTLALYAIITIFVTGKVIDTVVSGLQYLKTAIIISEKSVEVRTTILEKMGRGGTVFLAKGMFTDAPKEAIFCAVNQRELAILEEYVKDIDPKAFMMIFDTREVLGEGFKSFDQATS